VLRWASKLAEPERTVICTVGDGSYMFGVPTAAHYVSQSQNLPILFVIFNNGSWKAVRDATLHVHPDGWAGRHDRFSMWDLRPSPHFEKLADAFEAHGERVDDPAEIIPRSAVRSR
jgi:acetolactate synthase I/II/III large subunit